MWPIIILRRPEQRSSDSIGCDLQFVALLGGFGGADNFAETLSSFALCLLRIFCCGVHGRDDGRLELDNANGRLVRDILENMLDHRWSYAIPIPIFFALSGTLVCKWFSGFDKSAAIAANFTVSSLILIPSILGMSYSRPLFPVD